MKPWIYLFLALVAGCNHGPTSDDYNTWCDQLSTQFEATRIPMEHPKSSFRCQFRLKNNGTIELTEENLVGAVAALNILMGEKRARVWEPCFKACLKKGNFMCKNPKVKKCSMVKSADLIDACQFQCEREADQKVRSIYE